MTQPGVHNDGSRLILKSAVSQSPGFGDILATASGEPGRPGEERNQHVMEGAARRKFSKRQSAPVSRDIHLYVTDKDWCTVQVKHSRLARVR